MGTCPRCGAPMQQVFTTTACSAECDLKQATPIGKGQLTSPLEHILSHRALKACIDDASLDDAYYWAPDGKWWNRNRSRKRWHSGGPATKVIIEAWWKYFAHSDREWEPCDPPEDAS